MTRYLFQKPRISSGYYSGAVSYDRDGRLVADSTRHIAAVEYEAWGGLLPRTIDMGADKINLRYRPDGRLALRQHARRYMEIYRDSRGNVRERWRTALDTHTYRGSFELHGSRWVYHTDCGFITLADGTPHYYACDYQGSTRAVYTPLLTEISPLSVSPTMPEPYFIEQATDYYPSGLPVDVTASVSGGAATAAATDRLHIGNRWIDHAGLGWYDNTARYHDAILARFTAPDPLEYKYPSLSPYTHCAANPANLTDPTGLKPTPYEAAVLANAVYMDWDKVDEYLKDHLVGESWRLSKRKTKVRFSDTDGLNDFQSMLFERTKRNGEIEYAYVFAGTASVKDFIEDIRQLSGISLQIGCAVKNATILVNELHNKELTYVGHSLGGLLATASAMSTDGFAMTFNTAVMTTLTKLFNGIDDKKGHIHNYIATTTPILGISFILDYVTVLQRGFFLWAPGEIIKVPIGFTPSHKIEKLIEALK